MTLGSAKKLSLVNQICFSSGGMSNFFFFGRRPSGLEGLRRFKVSGNSAQVLQGLSTFYSGSTQISVFFMSRTLTVFRTGKSDYSFDNKRDMTVDLRRIDFNFFRYLVYMTAADGCDLAQIRHRPQLQQRLRHASNSATCGSMCNPLSASLPPSVAFFLMRRQVVQTAPYKQSVFNQQGK